MTSVAALVGCSPVKRFHGYAPDPTQLEDVAVGRDTRSTVAEKIGRPGVAGVMDGGAWYYVQSDWEERGWRAPVELRREVVAISFDDGDRVSNIERFGLDDGNVVPLSRRVTDTGRTTGSVLRQLLGSLGRFNPAQVLSDS